MIPVDLHIPVLLEEIREKHGLTKTASLVDAIIGAPVGALAARLAVGEQNKDTATKRGLVMGALLGFLAGQEAVRYSMEGVPLPPHKYPLIASAAGGAGAGLYTRWRPPAEPQPPEEKKEEGLPIDNVLTLA
jgi:hypothetical protein